MSIRIIRCCLSLFVLIFFFCLAGCGGKIDLHKPVEEAKKEGGIYHSFWHKDNLWLVAEVYDVSVKKLAQENDLRTPLEIERGEKIFIPGAEKRRDVEYKDPRWNVMLKSMSWPLRGEIIRDWDSEFFPEGLNGIAIKADEGAIIRAARDGWVVYEGEDFEPYGRMIILQHRYVLASFYACNSENLVKVGMRVDEGEPIAKVGKCPGHIVPTLHFEVIHYKEQVNPHRAFETSYEEMLKKNQSEWK